VFNALRGLKVRIACGARAFFSKIVKYKEEKTTMVPGNLFFERLYRLSAWTGILSGIFIIIKKLIVETLLPVNPISNAVGTLGLTLGLFTLTGVYIYQRSESGQFGLIGYLANWFGLAFVAGVDYAKLYILPYLSKNELAALLAGPTKIVFLVCAILFLIGVVLFGIASLRARVFPAVAIVLYMVGFVIYSLQFLFSNPLVVQLAEAGGAVGIIWFGYALLMAVGKMRTTTTTQSEMTVRA
jgi:hypothetical protein